MIKFDNKLELRYYFNDKSNYMDAMIKHRSEKEVLSLVRTLADMLDIKMTVYCESFAQQEGFREIRSHPIQNTAPPRNVAGITTSGFAVPRRC